MGLKQVSFIERCLLFRGKIIHQSIRMGLKQVSFIERCLLFRGSFIGGSTVHILMRDETEEKSKQGQTNKQGKVTPLTLSL